MDAYKREISDFWSARKMFHDNGFGSIHLEKVEEENWKFSACIFLFILKLSLISLLKERDEANASEAMRMNCEFELGG